MIAGANDAASAIWSGLGGPFEQANALMAGEVPGIAGNEEGDHAPEGVADGFHGGHRLRATGGAQANSALGTRHRNRAGMHRKLAESIVLAIITAVETTEQDAGNAGNAPGARKLILHNDLSPGDIVMLTATVYVTTAIWTFCAASAKSGKIANRQKKKRRAMNLRKRVVAYSVRFWALAASYSASVRPWQMALLM